MVSCDNHLHQQYCSFLVTAYIRKIYLYTTRLVSNLKKKKNSDECVKHSESEITQPLQK